MIGLIITLLVSGIVTAVCYPFVNILALPFIFTCSILLQFLIWYVIVHFQKNHLIYLQQQLRINELDVLKKYTCNIKCANCDYEYETIAFINEENVSICPKCKQKNKLIIDIKPVIVLENIQDINMAQNEIYDKLTTLS